MVTFGFMETEGITIGGVTYSDDLATILSAPKDIRALELIRGVRCIGRCAFEGCKNLRIVHIPETVVWIEDFAFRDCTAIQELHLPYYLEYVSPLAFTKSEKENGFLLVIPRVVIPEDAFRKYAYMLPQYIAWDDSNLYGVDYDALMEDDIFDDLFGFPIIVNEEEVYRMFIETHLRGQYRIASDLKADVKVSHADEEEIGRVVWEDTLLKCNFIQAEELVRTEDYPVVNQIDESFSKLVEVVVKDNYEFGWDYSPLDTLNYTLQECVKTAFILPVTAESLDWSGEELIVYDKNIVAEFENERLPENQRLEEWYSRMSFDCSGIVMFAVQEYHRRAYDMSVPLLKKLFLSCMRTMFRIGLSYGIIYNDKQSKNPADCGSVAKVRG